MEITGVSAAPKHADATAKKAAKAGAQFEAVLLNNVLGGVERAFTELPGAQHDQSNEAYSGLAMQTLTSALAETGGIGLGKLIAKALVRHGEKSQK